MVESYDPAAPTVPMRAVITRAAGRSPLLAVAVAVVLGVLLGVCSRLLPGTPLEPVVDTVAFWALCGFAAGAFAARPVIAVLAAVVTEGVALAIWYGYNWATTPGYSWAVFGPYALIWGVGAIVAGTVFGLAGSWWRTRSVSPRAELAAALPVAVELWAAAYALVILNYVVEGLWALVISGVLLAALPRTNRDRLRTAVAVVPITALGLLAGALFTTVVYRVI